MRKILDNCALMWYNIRVKRMRKSSGGNIMKAIEARLRKIVQERKREAYKGCESSIKELLSDKRKMEIKKNEEI